MSVVIETTLGDITVDLFLLDRPRACLNFLKLCKIKYYNYNLFHTISRGFIAQTGDPTGSRTGGESIYGILSGPDKRYFTGEKEPRIKHTKMGLISFVGDEESLIGSQFFFTLGEDLTYLDPKHCVFGEVVEGLDILEIINETICDTDDRPYQDVRITHTVILDDPYPDPKRLSVPSRSPSPTPERLRGGRIAPDEEIDETEGKSQAEVVELQAEREAKARATILEMVGDIPDAEMAPPENVLFVCKLNPITTDDDLEIIFNRFGKIKSCEVIRDKKTGDSLQYAFIEFEDQKSCEDAYFKMDNILIDDRRIHVDFSQSVSKIKWHGKGRGVTYVNPNKIDQYINDSKGNVKPKQPRDRRDDSSEHTQKSSNYQRYERNHSYDQRKSQKYSDYRNNDSHKYKQSNKFERKRRSRSASLDRKNRRERSHSTSRNYKKASYDSDNRERKNSRDYRKERRCDSSDSKVQEKYKERSKQKQGLDSKVKSKKSSRKVSESTDESDCKSKERKNKGKNKHNKKYSKGASTDSDYEHKRNKKRKQESSESENEAKKTKRSHSSDREFQKRHKNDDKKKVKSKKVDRKYSSDSSGSESDEKSTKNIRKSDKKNSKYRQHSSDSEAEQKSTRKTKKKRKEDSSSDSDSYRKSKSKKR